MSRNIMTGCLFTRLLLPLSLVLAWTGSASGVKEDPWERVLLSEPVPTAFSVCMNYSCKRILTVSLTDEEWRRVAMVFARTIDDPMQERVALAEAVALMEVLVGPKVGAEGDRGGSFPGVFSSGQMDCVDERTNTRTYLIMFKASGWLRFHELAEDAWRGYLFFGGWPHTATVIKQKGSAERFVIDSWFHDNGEPPEIVPLERWEDGWDPGEG